MIINIDTRTLNALDVKLLNALTEGLKGQAEHTEDVRQEVAQKLFSDEPQEAKEEQDEAPKRKRRTKAEMEAARAAEAEAKKAAETDQEDDSDEDESDEDEDLLGTGDSPDVEPPAYTMELATEVATAKMKTGEVAAVKAALAKVGAKRVTELRDSQLAPFIQALS